jgi:hypothetical protein
LEESGQKVVSWSNGNIFRSVTLLAATWCELNGLSEFDPDKALSKDQFARLHVDAHVWQIPK